MTEGSDDDPWVRAFEAGCTECDWTTTEPKSHGAARAAARAHAIDADHEASIYPHPEVDTL